jgi:hypothetical protein
MQKAPAPIKNAGAFYFRKPVGREAYPKRLGEKPVVELIILGI